MSPRSCCGLRVVEKKRPLCGGVIDGFVNIVKKHQRCESSSNRDLRFSTSDTEERFCNIQLQVSSLLFHFSIIFLILLFNSEIWELLL